MEETTATETGAVELASIESPTRVPVWKSTEISGLHIHTPSGRYYTRFMVNGKRAYRALRTSDKSVALARFNRVVEEVQRQRAELQVAKGNPWKDPKWSAIDPWNGVPLSVWNRTVDIPPITMLCRGVYLLGKDDEIVYIGRAINVHRRIIAHLEDRKDPKDFNQARVIPCVLGTRDAPEALEGWDRKRYNAIEQMEEVLIRWLKPKYNRNGIRDIPSADPEDQFLQLVDWLRIPDLNT